MQTTSIRQALHDYIDHSDEKLLKLMFALAKEYHEDDNLADEFTVEDIKELDERWKSLQNGESKLYTWEEAREIIIN